MCRRVYCLIVILCFAVTSVAAQGSVSGNTHYSPIDYMALARELERASQPTLWQRLTGAMSKISNEQTDSGFRLNGSIGVGYTQETNAMFVGSALAQYMTREALPQSYTSLVGMFSVNGAYRLRALGNLYLSNKEYLRYNVGGGEMPVRFWGLGYDVADNSPRSEYARGNFDAEVMYVREIAKGFSVGAGVDFIFIEASDMEPLAEEYLHLAGVENKSVSTLGLNLMAEYSRLQQRESQIRGYSLHVQGAFYPELVSNQTSNIWHVEAAANYYQPLWWGAVAAFDIYADLRSKHSPWLLWSRVGGESRMRGYYYGRYIDRQMMTAQVELRQRIYGPISCVAWGGAASIFPTFEQIDFDELLPNYGLGIRVAVKGRTSLRVDYGFGRHSNGFVVNVNEAF